MKKFIVGFMLGFIVGPLVVVCGFGIYTQHRIAEIDKQAAMVSAFNEPHQILDIDHYQNPWRRLTNKPINPASPFPPEPPQAYP